MIINNAVASPSLAGSIDLLIKQKLNHMRFCTFAKVVAVHREYKTIDAQPSVAEAVNQPDGKRVYKQLPIIYNIPYFVGHTPTVGEDCVLVHLDRAVAGRDVVDDDTETGIVKNKGESHTLSSCVAICGFVNSNFSLKDISKQNAENSVTQNNDELLKPVYDDIEQTATQLYDDIEQLRKDLIDQVYPVGSIYISTSHTDPATLFGGTWERILDKFLAANGGVFIPGTTGGATHHKHTLENGFAKYIPRCDTSGSSYEYINVKKVSSYMPNEAIPSSTNAKFSSFDDWKVDVGVSLGGSTDSENNLPPYMTVYMWKRISDDVSVT